MLSGSEAPTAALSFEGYNMRPKPFVPETFNGDERYVRDKTDGLVWHRCRQRILYADTDRSQCVYHGNYLRYFEFGRASLMRDTAYPYREIEESGYVYPIIEIGVTYHNPLCYDDSIVVYTRPVTLELVRIRFDYIIGLEETYEIICKGFTRHCAVNSSGNPVKVDSKTAYLWKTFPK